MDEDIDHFTREQLVAEVRRLRAGIRRHRDSTKQELCWHHPELWSLLPERTDLQPRVPPWPEFMTRCAKYRQALEDELVAPKTVAPTTRTR